MRKLVRHRGLLACLAIVLLTSQSLAGNCAHVSYGGYYQQPYVAPTYQTPYYPPTYILEHPYAVPVLTHDNFFSVAPELAQLRINKELVEDTANKSADKAAQRTLDSFIAAMKANGLFPTNAPQPPPQPGTLATPQAKQGGSNLEKLQAMANESCLRCHNGPGKNKIDLSNIAALTELQLLKVQQRIIKSPKDPLFMPKLGKERVADEYIDAANARVDEVTASAQIPPAK